MKRVIYYFSGTGNSLFAAKELAAQLGDCELIPIAAVTEQSEVTPSQQQVGLVFPLYYYGLPKIVREFVSKLRLQEGQYLFTLVTATYPVGSALKQLQTMLLKKGRNLDFGSYLKMPGNYTIKYKTATAEKRAKIISQAKKQLVQFARQIEDEQRFIKKEGFVFKWLAKKLYPKWIETVTESDRNFVVSDACNGCGVCEKICPVSNITIQEKKPHWNGGCEQCLACLHSCPQNAICWKSVDKQPVQYRNPEVTSSELIILKKERV